MSHLLTGCSFTRTMRHEVLLWIRSSARTPVAEDAFMDWWHLAIHSTPSTLRKGTALVIKLTAWWIWKQQNAAVFDNASPNFVSLLKMMKADARSRYRQRRLSYRASDASWHAALYHGCCPFRLVHKLSLSIYAPRHNALRFLDFFTSYYSLGKRLGLNTFLYSH